MSRKVGVLTPSKIRILYSLLGFFVQVKQAEQPRRFKTAIASL